MQFRPGVGLVLVFVSAWDLSDEGEEGELQFGSCVGGWVGGWGQNWQEGSPSAGASPRGSTGLTGASAVGEPRQHRADRGKCGW